jgi:Domain of unknown function DUF29
MTITFSNPHTLSATHAALYEQDYVLWLDQAVDLLRSQNLAEIDIENLIAELAEMGGSQKQAIESNLEVLLMHLLKYKYQPDKRSNSWRYTIIEHRLRLYKAFKHSPSLKRYFWQEFAECYLNARKLTSRETGLAISTFPIESPFSPEQTLDEDFLPEA